MLRDTLFRVIDLGSLYASRCLMCTHPPDEFRLLLHRLSVCKLRAYLQKQNFTCCHLGALPPPLRAGKVQTSAPRTFRGAQPAGRAWPKTQVACGMHGRLAFRQRRSSITLNLRVILRCLSPAHALPGKVAGCHHPCSEASHHLQIAPPCRKHRFLPAREAGLKSCKFAIS